MSSTRVTDRTGPVLAWTGFLLVLLARGLRTMLVTFLVVASIPVVSSWSGYVVRSGSMEPRLSVGDVVIARPLDADAPIPVGRVMVFDNPDTGSSHHTMVHRVVEKLDQDLYTTAGDANRENDSTAVPKENFLALPSINVPYIALPLTWWADRDLGRLLFWLTLVSAVLYFSIRPPCDPQHRRRAKEPSDRGSRRRRMAGAGRVSVVLVPAVLVTSAVVAAPVEPADAAFTATTANKGSTWKVSGTLSRTLVLQPVAEDVRGTIPLGATLNETSGRTFTVRFEYASAGTTVWRTICSDSTAPYGCSWATTGVANADYDLRAVATAGSTTYTSELVEDVTVDNTPPVTTMQDPGSPLRGIVTTSATATDSPSGVAEVAIQYAPSGSTTFKDVCRTTEAPYSCRFDTTTVADGTYTFRSVATDAAGNTTTSVAVTNRVVDNTVASVSVDDPGAYLTGTVPVTATATSSAGISSVRIQRAPAGTTTWTDICTDSVSPFTCSWATTGVADGLYDLRAVMLDKLGRTTTSATVAGRRVDNSPMRGYDVQTTNGGATAGKLDNGDTLTLTYTQQAALGSIASGWSGAATSVTVRLRDGGLLGLGSSDDTVTVLRNGVTLNLGSINLRQNYIKLLRTADFAATMTASTTTVNGVTATRITLRIGAQTSGTSVATVTSSSTMVWTPSAAATNTAGRAASTTPTAELGTADREF